MRDAMTAHFARNPLANERPDDLGPTCLDVIDLLSESQPFWDQAKPRQLSTSYKRYLSLYDLVRSAYADRAKTEAAIADFII